MVKKLLGIGLCIAMLASTTLALAGGPVMAAPVKYSIPCAGAPMGAPYGAPYGGGGAFSGYWGDAPFPGLCGGIVALPFLVVGSLLGGSPLGGNGCPPAAPAYNCGPRPPIVNPCAPPAPGCAPYAQACAPSFGLPCLDLCGSVLGAVSTNFNCQ
jgi:hypothetical protein